MSRKRTVTQKVLSQWTNEGVGARVRRSIGRSELHNLDPFLLLDEFLVSAPAGFPDHPHRGFETVTYLLSGTVAHEDFLGNKGEINDGDLQWMTAGRGVVHCEMVKGDKPAHGLQLWVNLAKDQKMIEPAWQDLLAKDVPRAERDGVQVKIIAGKAMDIESPIYTRTPTFYLDFHLQPGASHVQATPLGWTVFAYIIDGTLSLGGDHDIPAHNTVIFSDGDSVEIRNSSSADGRVVLIGGKPIGEPIVQLGPFVMNSDQEIKETQADYHHARNGFERAKNWNSSYVD